MTTVQKRSQQHEERLARHYKGRRLVQSGGMKWSKWDAKKTLDGDVLTPDFLIEHKYTDKKSLSVKTEWLDKVTRGARSYMKQPLLIITFDKPQGDPQDWVVLPREHFDRLIGAGDDD